MKKPLIHIAQIGLILLNCLCLSYTGTYSQSSEDDGIQPKCQPSTDLSVFSEATFFHIRDTSDVRFRTLINHENFRGNDDAAKDVKVRISYPWHMERPSSACQVFNDTRYCVIESRGKGYIVYKIDTLERIDHIDIELIFPEALDTNKVYQFKVEVYNRVWDRDLSDNSLMYSYSYDNGHCETYGDYNVPKVNCYTLEGFCDQIDICNDMNQEYAIDPGQTIHIAQPSWDMITVHYPNRERIPSDQEGEALSLHLPEGLKWSQQDTYSIQVVNHALIPLEQSGLSINACGTAN